jgi:two-component system OmpR family sensor kinase
MKIGKLSTYIPALLSLVFGLVAALIIKIKFGQNIPVLFIYIDFASLLIFVSILVSLTFLLYLRLSARQAARAQALLDNEKEEHKQFLMRLDHELKNPLSAIKTAHTYLDQLAGDIKPKRSQIDFQKSLTQIGALTERINRLILDLRKLAELETYEIELMHVNIHQLLEQLVADASTNPAAENKEMILSLPSAPWQLPELFTDGDLLYLCLTNMLDNAMKYTPENGNIEIRAYENRESIFIEIADSGVGIPAEEIDKVWGKLYRAKNSRGVPGNGLGLSIVETITRRLGGKCDIRSQEDKGTVFTLELRKQKPALLD